MFLICIDLDTGEFVAKTRTIYIHSSSVCCCVVQIFRLIGVFSSRLGCGVFGLLMSCWFIVLFGTAWSLVGENLVIIPHKHNVMNI